MSLAGILMRNALKKKDWHIINFEQKISNIPNHDLINNELHLKAFIFKDWPWSKKAIRLLNSLYIPHDVIFMKNDEIFKK